MDIGRVSIGIHRLYNRFPLILRYWRPRLLNRVTLELNSGFRIYKWLWFYIAF